MVSYVPQVREEQMVRICLHVYVCVAPPVILWVRGRWQWCYSSLMSSINKVSGMQE